jgi:transcriptional regulator with XRE-family HTH domain
VPDTFAAVLRAQRTAAGLSRPALARRATLPAVTIHHFESGYIENPGGRSVAKLATALGVSADVLLAPFVCTPMDGHTASVAKTAGVDTSSGP